MLHQAHPNLKPFQVECKKAQPKEAVQAANTAALLGKRVILSNLGMVRTASLFHGVCKKRGELLLLFVNNDRTCSQVPTLGLPALTGPQQALAPQASLQTALQQQLAASAALGENNMFLHMSVYIVK